MSIPNYWVQSERCDPMPSAPEMKLVTYQVCNPPAETVWRRFAIACPIAVVLGIGTVAMAQQFLDWRNREKNVR